jgi:Rnl2 family RNA ligase
MEIVKIKSIKKIDIKSNRYDIEVEDNHNFFADGILVHNSNFSIWHDGETFKCAKRSGFLGEGESFFNWKDVLFDEKPKATKAWEYINENKSNYEKYLIDGEIKELVFFGELFGGAYPHPDIKRDYNSMTVQKGVYYSPSNLFYCFDVKINGRILTETEKGHLCTVVGIFWDEPLFEGTFEECLNYPNLFPTTISKRLGLPDIENNICEGVVIKPIEVKRSWAGGRVVFKNKNEKFAEVTGKKSGEKLMKQPKEGVTLSDDAAELAGILLGYATENRLRNVLSKIGQVNDKQFGLIVGHFIKDGMEDFLRDERERFEALESKEQKYLPKVFGAQCTTLLRNNFLNVIDGNY